MKLKHLILLTLVLVFGIAALVVLLTAPAERLDTDVFWVAFSFGIALNLVASVGFVLWSFAKTPAEFVRPPAAFAIIAVFSPILLIAGLIFMYADVTSLVWPIIVFAAISAAYFIFASYVTLSANYITSTEKQVQKKRLFIKLLEADILDCAAKASLTETRAALNSFAEAVRFSDPMSHKSLENIENDISSVVYEISADLSANPSADVTAKIKRAEAMLSSRNNRCVLLK